MTINRTDQGDETILAIAGALDESSAPEAHKIFDEVIEAKRFQVTLDLSELNLIDSTGVAAIISLYKRTHTNGGATKIVGIRDQPRAIFRLLRYDKLFDL